jgi:hypothetical protein
MKRWCENFRDRYAVIVGALRRTDMPESLGGLIFVEF